MKLFNLSPSIDWPFIKSIFSEPDGNGSSSRVLISMIVSFIVGVGIGFATRIHQPITMTDFVTFLGAAGMFITTTVAPLYLINKGSDAYKNKLTSTELTKTGPAAGPAAGPGVS
jgi:hypothetical protein